MTNQGRRRHYRVQSGSEDALRARLSPADAGGKSQRQATVLNTSAGGAGLEMAENSARWLEMDLPVSVEFRLQGSPDPFLAEARVVRLEPSTSDPGRVRVGLSFTEPRRLYAQLDARGWSYFNRRRSERISFGASDDLPNPTLRLVAPGLSLRCEVQDLSIHGLCCAVPAHDAAELGAAPRVRIEVRFSDREPLRFEAAVRHLTPFGITTRVGLSFEADPGGSSSQRESTLARLLLGLQRRIAVP